MKLSLTSRLVGALAIASALTVVNACDDGGGSADGTAASAPDTADATSTTPSPDSTEPAETTDDAGGDTTPPTSEPTPTMAPALPEEELPERLLEVFTNNFGDANFAFCVQQEVLKGLEAGDIQPVDIDNYVRNLVSDPMRDLLLSIQNDATCSA